MNIRRALPVAITAAAVALSGAAVPALAKHGADDPPGDDRGGQVTTTTGTTTTGTTTTGSDDNGGDRRREEVRVAGRCSGRSTAKLKAKHDDGRLETEFEVDQNRNGVRWNVRIRRNGATAVTTRAVTRAPSGSFSVERKIADGAGSDRITARATSLSGEVCTASLSIS